ncbi:hypothetical protein HDU96_004748 [Phlyctochytrium bullatum]|nr:hypothetical protein HDU96_004748 [Phlyctochytrium bullatum]
MFKSDEDEDTVSKFVNEEEHASDQEEENDGADKTSDDGSLYQDETDGVNDNESDSGSNEDLSDDDDQDTCDYLFIRTSEVTFLEENAVQKDGARKLGEVRESHASDGEQSEAAFEDSDSGSDFGAPRKRKRGQKSRRKRSKAYETNSEPRAYEVRFSSRNKTQTNYNEAAYDDQFFEELMEDEEDEGQDWVQEATPTEDSTPEYYIKWQGLSYRRNTWNTAESLVNVKGYRKLERFVKRLEEDQREREDPLITKEEIEQKDIQIEMMRAELEEYKVVERVIASREVEPSKNNEQGGTEYLCKWQRLSYKECTWEPAEEISTYQAQIDDFLERNQSQKVPHRSKPYAKHRPDFKKIAKQPDYITYGELRDYQLIGVNWMAYLWHRNENGILADEMGLGKTIQSISFLNYLFHSMDLYGPFLVVVPLSTIGSWQKEFSRWAPEMNVVCYTGNGDSRAIIREHEFYLPSKSKERIKFNVLLTTFELVLKDRDTLGHIKWAYLMVDEAHRLKNSGSQLHEALKDFYTANRLLITGTPLQNSVKELVSLIHFLMPDKFKEFENFEIVIGAENQEEKIKDLQQRLENYMLRRLKKDVEKSMPTKTERILRVELSPMQFEYYKNIYSRNFAALNKGVAAGSQSTLLNIAMELKKAANHPYLFPNAEVLVPGRDEQLRGMIANSGKMVLLDKLLARLYEGGHRVLIFSQMVRLLDILTDYLVLRGYQHQRLDGSTGSEARKRAMDHFNAPGSQDFVFILSTRAGGLGLNLETADTVIIFDSDWNPQNDLQAMARAHRIGQKKAVNVYRFVSKDTIEEEVIERAKRKMVLEYCIIKQMDTSGETLISKKPSKMGNTQISREELQTILKFGAQNLFKPEEGSDGQARNKLEEMNLDEILSRAEHHDSEEATGAADGGAAFLEQWRVEDVAMNQLSWEEIIPEKDRAKEVEEDQYLGPRQRKPHLLFGVERTNSDDEHEGKKASGDRKKGNRGKKSLSKMGPLEEKEVRALIRGLLKYGSIEDRFEDIVKSAEVEHLSRDAIEKVYKEIWETCNDAVNQAAAENVLKDGDGTVAAAKSRNAKPKMVSASYLSVSNINASQLIQRIHDLQILHKRMTAVKDSSKFRLAGTVKPPNAWHCTWSQTDDSKLLIGIYRHGFGSWRAIQDDPSLPFKKKFFLSSSGKDEEEEAESTEKPTKSRQDTKGGIPKATHLVRRAEFLFKLLKEEELVRERRAQQAEEKKEKQKARAEKSRSKGASKAAPPPAAESNDELKEGVNSRKRSRSKQAKQSPAKTKAAVEPIPQNDSGEESAASNQSMDPAECKEIMRPVKKELSALRKQTNRLSGNEKAAFIKETLKVIGDQIYETATKTFGEEAVSEREKLVRHLWKFASMFWPRQIRSQQVICGEYP